MVSEIAVLVRLIKNKIFHPLMLLFFISSSYCSDGRKKATGFKTFSDVIACKDSMQTAKNSGVEVFIRKDVELGLVAPHGFDEATWSLDNTNRIWQVMIAGGLTAAYVNDDCWPDIIFAGGDKSGMVAYINKGEQSGFINQRELLSGAGDSSLYKLFTGVAVADLTGSYKRELVLGNLFTQSVIIMSAAEKSALYFELDRLPMSRSTYGISFGDINSDGLLDMFLAHFGFEEVDGKAPALWLNLGDAELIPFDKEGGTARTVFDQRYNFVPQFVDVRNSGHQDLLIASDFETSAVLQNRGNGFFDIVTDRDVIKDEAGMGSAVGDIDNNGLLDWFVTSIFGDKKFAILGNRLYKNESSLSTINFSDITEFAGVKDGAWGWAACMADFNHDGFLDIFHVNGFGYIPAEIRTSEFAGTVIDNYAETFGYFIGKAPVLFINNGDGIFTDATSAWGLDVPSEGRGVICFDYDRDGDIDIALTDHSTGIQFFENQIGHGKGKRFLNIRLVGESPNTDAIGAKVFVTADVGNGHGMQRQMRVSHANSNFNSQNLPDIHFGVGETKTVEFLRIEWTDGSGLLCENVTSNQFLVFDQRDKAWPKTIDSGLPACNWYESINSAVSG